MVWYFICIHSFSVVLQSVVFFFRGVVQFTNILSFFINVFFFSDILFHNGSLLHFSFLLFSDFCSFFLSQIFYFLKFGSLFFLEMAFNDSSQHFLRSSRGKITKEKSWAQISTKRGKIRPKTRFFAIFLRWVHWFSLKLHTVVACDNA